MVKLEVNGKQGDVNITLPELVNELTPEYLRNVTSEINIADNYSLVALCHKEKLSAFVLAGRKNQNQISTAVVPVFVKMGKIVNGLNKNTTDGFLNCLNAGDKLLISPTAMSLGLHVNVPKNTLNMSLFVSVIDGDNNIYAKASKINKEVIFVEYKLIPNNEIIGAYNGIVNSNFDNPFSFKYVNADDTANS